MTNRMLAFKVNVVPYCCNHNISTRATSTLKANVQYASHFHSFTTIRLHVFADMSEFFMLTTGNCGNLLATKAYLFLYAARFMLMNECLLSHWNWWWRGGCRLVTKSTSLMLYDALAIILFQNLMLQAEGGADWETKNTCMTATIHNLNVMVHSKRLKTIAWTQMYQLLKWVFEMFSNVLSYNHVNRIIALCWTFKRTQA